jgi:hypothetical protein
MSSSAQPLKLSDLEAFGNGPGPVKSPQTGKTLTLADLEAYGKGPVPAAPKYTTGSVAGDAFTGVGAGVIHIPVGIYDAIRRIPGVSDLLPEPNQFVRDLTRTPDTTAGKVGRFLEGAAEFAVPAGEVAKLTDGMGMLTRVAAQAGVGAGVGAEQSGGDPVATGVSGAMGAAGPIIGGVADAIANKLPARLYKSALQPTRTMLEDNPGMIDAGLQARLPVSPGSLSKIHDAIQDLRDDINSGVTTGSQAGATVDPNRVTDALDELHGMYQNSANPNLGGGVKAIEKVKADFLKAHAGGMPLDDAQQMKINTHTLLRDAYGDMKGAEVEATKHLARGLKEQIETVFPEIAGMNEKQSTLMGLDDAMSRAVWRMENRDMLPMGAGVAALGGHAIAGGAGAVTGAVAKALDIPELKSRLALALTSRGVKKAAQLINDRIAQMTALAQTPASQPSQQ